MNCEKGDLAIVIASNAGNLGRVVTCIELLEPGAYVDGYLLPLDKGWGWRVDQNLNALVYLRDHRGEGLRVEVRVDVVPAALDRCLMPLRGLTPEEVLEAQREAKDLYSADTVREAQTS